MADAPRSRFWSGRHAGILVPLFSIPGRRSWGLGEIPDLVPLAKWLAEAGLDFVQFLPMNEMQAGQSSPYSALSAMAIDPIYIAVEAVEDWTVDPVFSGDDRALLERIRNEPRVDYGAVRALKGRALRRAFGRFRETVAGRDGDRDRRFRAFQDRERWWLDDYALFRALLEENGGRHWRDWEPGVRNRVPSALVEARRRLRDEIAYYAYLQWLAGEQWHEARRAADPVGLFGDFPFMVSSHSADVWARQHEFDIDASVGTPPDAFSETGQDWGLPPYRWDVVRAGNFGWLRERARRSSALYDGYRIDHLIGFFRTYVRKPGAEPGFWPPDEADQRAMGDELLSLFLESGASLIGEDLGTVPDFLRETLARRGVPGMKVLRWEREWTAPDQPFIDPATYAAASAATSGTHDTETMADWWDAADEEERRAIASIPSLRPLRISEASGFTDGIRDALLAALYGAGSQLLILPIQDIFGWRDRVNVPALISDVNWSWRLPGPVEDLLTDSGGRERATFLADLSRRTGRFPS